MNIVLRVVALVLAVLVAAPAEAARKTMTCTAGSFAQLSPAPARIIVPAATAPGAALWGGTVSVGFSCTSNASGVKLGGGNSAGGSGQTAMVSSTGVADGISLVATGPPSLVLTSPGCALNGASEKASSWSFGLQSTASGTCAGTLVVPLQFVRDTNAVGGDVAAHQPLGTGSGASDWLVFPTSKGGGSSSDGLSAAVPVLAGGGCTVSPVALTVSLPRVAVAALHAPGLSAGATSFRFPLQSCQPIASTPYSVYASWSFSAMPGYPSVLANTAPGAAANVGVQIIDATGTPVSSGPAASTLVGNVDTTGGVLAQTYIARYFATGVASPGAVSATATYTLTYQ